MTIHQCIQQLLEVEDKRKGAGPTAIPACATPALLPASPNLSPHPRLADALSVYSRSSLAFGVARVGQPTQRSAARHSLLEGDMQGSE